MELPPSRPPSDFKPHLKNLHIDASKRDCIEKFGPETVERIIKDNDAICTTEYSRIVPLENGEVVVSLVNGRPGAMNFSYSPVLRDFTKATSIRLRFLRTNTLLGHLMGKALRDPTVTRRYYYSIKDISIGGRCVCNGHADMCTAKDPTDPYRLHCDCQHNTCGGSCDQCCPGYNQLQWKPATTDSANECEACNCNGHAFNCMYDPEVDKHKGSLNTVGRFVGGGVCINCQHNTTGVNCGHCATGYYRTPGVPIESVDACIPCNCNSEFMEDICDDGTGRCYCKYNYAGETCESCALGYYDFPNCYSLPVDPIQSTELQNNVGKIINCDCNSAGTENNNCQPDLHTGRCNCKPNFTGRFCTQCVPQHFGANCQPCRCSGPGIADGACNEETGQCFCRQGFEGFYCELCVPGYFNYPLCQLCSCSMTGSLPEVCDPSGQCLCKAEFDGARCDQCQVGFHSYPHCHACSCDPRGSVDNVCGSTGQCQCQHSYSGLTCNQCGPGYFGHPSCTPCRCNVEGSYINTCDPETGRCSCRPFVTGLHCDTCVPGAYGFPNCRVGSCNPAGSVSLASDIDSCQCRMNVEGSVCDTCKPLYWNLTPENPQGCSICQCYTDGTLNSVAECMQSDGQCFCKPNVCRQSCMTCKPGYYSLSNRNYFGCKGCQCDIGGSVGGLTCDDRSGRCQCRQNVEGRTCSQAKPDHYFPDLHHLRSEIEDGTTPEGRPVRFGFSLLEFEDFSWRGYALMSHIQNKVKVAMHVKDSKIYLFRFILRYINTGPATLYGKVTAYMARRKGSEQTKQIIFAPSVKPSFVTVPQNTFVEPFVLNPGIWSIVIEAQDILLDYLVLLPSAYYEAPILQLKVTEPCMYTRSADDTAVNCLLYRYLSLHNFPSLHPAEGSCAYENYLHSQCQVIQPTPRHPPMVILNHQQANIRLRLRVPHSGAYVILIEYATEADPSPSVDIIVNGLGEGSQSGTIILNDCKYSFLCRGVTIDSLQRVAVYELPTDVELQIIADSAGLLLSKVYLIPHEDFNMEYVQPNVHCISTHGAFTSDGSSCAPSRFQKPSQSIMLTEGQTSSASTLLHLHPLGNHSIDQLHRPQQPSLRPATIMDTADVILLGSPRTVVTFSDRVQTLGRYAFVIHFYQPEHPTFPAEVLINGGRLWQGYTNASFCPHAYGCRSTVLAENKIVLDVTDNDVSVIIRVPDGKTLWLGYMLIVPETSYNPNYLVEEPLDKSYDFISGCGANSFYVNPATTSTFCKHSAISLSAFYNNGALPCACHEVGASRTSCDPFGGQCICRPNVIGRDCTRCVTGYYGFPNCRPCNCGKRLCEEVTGQCICPPRTIKPECIVCQPQTFGCHPLVGCEECNCSRVGVQNLTNGCNIESGQCRCKPNVAGRQCSRCAPGYYHYPNCMLCDCDEAGTEASVCDSLTGQCHCKENVEGPHCNTCRLGTFYLDPANPKGCTSCFCFGATNRCHSSTKRRSQLVHMHEWSLVSADHHELPVSFNPMEMEVEADLRDIPDVYQELYWRAPPTFLGDQVSSYGGYLTFQLRSEVLRGDILSVPVEARSDVILKGNQMTIMYVTKDYPSPGQLHEDRVQLVESNFRHMQTHNPVSREELMMVLASLDALRVRALHSPVARLVGLRNVELERASLNGSGIPASNVEICLCPANYMGDSCQDCARGYYRDTKGLFLGKCVPCNCNGHSDQCLDGSGICINCQHNTEGDRCERCKTGLVEHVPEGEPSLCVQCPCPLTVASNNFAKDCIDRGDHMQCLCKPGYAGVKCERCAPGYFGNPLVLGSRCQPCTCHGNTDSNMLFSSCDWLTGTCQGCVHHTAGHNCEFCAPGFFGDAVAAKNCTPCDCLLCGTESCDRRTGECRCKPGITGHRCDRCEDGRFGYDTCAGCQRCACDLAALEETCHTVTGQCQCAPGIGGRQCQQCAPGYWRYTPHGCRECECNGGPCNPRTGACTCTNGLGGRQCDTCLQRYQMPIVDAANYIKCEPCDSCVLALLETLNRTEQMLPTLSAQLAEMNISSIAWTRMRSLSNSIRAVTDELSRSRESQELVRDGADELETDSMNLTPDLDALEEKVTVTNRKVTALGESIGQTYRRSGDLLSNIQDLREHILDLIAQMNKTQSDISAPSTEEFLEKFAEVQKLLEEMRMRDFRSQRNVAEKEEDEANKLLERVKEKMEQPLQEIKDNADSIRDQIAKHNSKLMDLRDALNEAVNKTSQANEKNKINQLLLAENKQKIEELETQHKRVTDLFRMAKDGLVQVSDLLQMLENAKEEQERLAAMLDGARMALIEKVKHFSPASTKIPIVERAEEHARSLDQLAANLSRVIEDTNQDGFILRAVSASNAYSSIIEAVKKAENAARDANNAAVKALKQVVDRNLSHKAAALKGASIQLEKEAKKARKKSEDVIKPALSDAKKRLSDARDKKGRLLTQLKSVQDFLKGIQRGDTADSITNAKTMAAAANSTVTSVEDVLGSMRKNLNQWREKYGGAPSDNENFNKTLQEANASVAALNETIPLLLDKLNKLEVRNQTSNISESINRIRELISQARSAANKVQVPMKFIGTSGVQLRSPVNPDDLKAYTSLSFSIQREKQARKRRQSINSSNQFILYLGDQKTAGDYMGVAMRSGKLVWVYKLGSAGEAVLQTDTEISDDRFDTVKLERIQQYGRISYTVEKGTITETRGDGKSKGNDTLLNLDPEDVVFYAGGYPPDFTPPAMLRYPNFEGCIELGTLNEEVISLYNLIQTFNLNTTADEPCRRYKSTQGAESDSSYFDGSGFAEIKMSSTFSTISRFEQEVCLASYNGILLFMREKDQFLSVAVQNARLVLYCKLNHQLKIEHNNGSNEKSISDGYPHQIQIIMVYSGAKMKIYVRVDRMTVLATEQQNVARPSFSLYYLGGAPVDKLPESLRSKFPTGGSVKGCMRSLKAMEKNLDLKREKTIGVSYGCSLSLLISRSADFKGQGYLSLTPENVPALDNNFVSGFGFQTQQRNALMFYYPTEKGHCQVSLKQGLVALKMFNTEVKSKIEYTDGSLHYISFGIHNQQIKMNIDDMEKVQSQISSWTRSQSRGLEQGQVYLGGAPSSSLGANLTGCIGNVFIYRKDSTEQSVVDLQQHKEMVETELNNCPKEKPPQQIRSPKKDKSKQAVINQQSKQQVSDSCQLPAQPTSSAHHFRGSSLSRLEYDNVPQTFRERSSFSMEVRCNSSHGMLFYVSNELETSYMTLMLSKGRFVFMFNVKGNKLRIPSKEKYNDGQWHTVFFSREKNRGQLVVDGLRTQTSTMSGTPSLDVQAPFYVGAVPLGKARKITQSPSASSFDGCIRNFQLDGKHMVVPSRMYNVIPCFEGSLEMGTFFAAGGGYVILDDAFVIGKNYELMFEVRPRSLSGILFHAGRKQSHYFSLYLENEKVILQINNGAGAFSAAVTPQHSLCDGQWHRIAVIKGKNVIQLDVDTKSNYTVGPAQSSRSNNKETLYAGGKPVQISTPSSIRSPFVGCIRNVLVNQRSVQLNRPGSLHGAVSANGCPVM
eukprot:gi/632973827/ref/XP_007903344.1/ PREDICTED: laminin subunit alpha-5 isoform X1 [Callorhinchus milii]